MTRITHKEQIVHVELKQPYNGTTHYYFGSVSAIFDTIPTDLIGVQLRTVRSRLCSDSEYQAPGAIIRRSIVIRKQQKKTQL